MSSHSAARQALERRTERRNAVRLPLWVRGTDRDGVRFEEHTECENVCRSGTAFATTHELDLGAEVEITIPLPKQGRESETDFATRGRVVHVAPGKEKRIRIIGVEFTGPRFHRVFLSESSA